MTRWGPDTCGCILDVNEEWTTAEVIFKCSAHIKVHNSDIFEQVYHKENKPKNELCSYIKENHPELVSDKPDTDCKFMAAYGISGTLSFDENRNIQVDIPNLSEEKKADIAAYAETKFSDSKKAAVIK